MSRATGYIVAGVAVALVVAGTAQFSMRSSTCMTCHTRQASYAQWMTTRLVAEKKGFSHELIPCASCHIEGGAEGTVMARLRSLLHTVTYLVPQIDPRRPQVSGLFYRTRIPSENCQYCHQAAIVRKAVYRKDLPPRLKRIGLTMDHRKHVLTEENTCARCHERYKDKQAGQADKTVNYAEVSHLACDSCHTSASHAYRGERILPMSGKQFLQAKQEAWKSLQENPRWMVAFPTMKSCRRCHNGKIHYKTRIFLADCRKGTNFENCVKCHPRMTKEYFKKHRQEQEKLTTASRTTVTGG